MRLAHRFLAPAVDGREARGVDNGLRLRGKERPGGETLCELLAVCHAPVVEGEGREGGGGRVAMEAKGTR